jgi:hypothetical protein
VEERKKQITKKAEPPISENLKRRRADPEVYPSVIPKDMEEWENMIDLDLYPEDGDEDWEEWKEISKAIEIQWEKKQELEEERARAQQEEIKVQKIKEINDLYDQKNAPLLAELNELKRTQPLLQKQWEENEKKISKQNQALEAVFARRFHEAYTKEERTRILVWKAQEDKKIAAARKENTIGRAELQRISAIHIEIQQLCTELHRAIETLKG